MKNTSADNILKFVDNLNEDEFKNFMTSEL